MRSSDVFVSPFVCGADWPHWSLKRSSSTCSGAHAPVRLVFASLLRWWEVLELEVAFEVVLAPHCGSKASGSLTPQAAVPYSKLHCGPIAHTTKTSEL